MKEDGKEIGRKEEIKQRHTEGRLEKENDGKYCRKSRRMEEMKKGKREEGRTE